MLNRIGNENVFFNLSRKCSTNNAFRLLPSKKNKADDKDCPIIIPLPAITCADAPVPHPPPPAWLEVMHASQRKTLPIQRALSKGWM